MAFVTRLIAPILRRFDNKPVLVFCGDSHLGAPQRAYRAGLFRGRRAHFVRVGGATAVGLRNPHSHSRAREKFRAALLPWRADVQPIFQLGEIDCGFLIWSQAARKGTTVDAEMGEALDAYAALLREMSAAGYRNGLVTSAILPTIRDGEQVGTVQGMRRRVRVSLEACTELTLRFNADLNTIAGEAGMTFVGLDDDLLDHATGLIREELRHPDPEDHHLHPDRGAEIWARRLQAALHETDPRPL